MRIPSLVVLSAMFIGLNACGKGKAEICNDNADNNGDGLVDCLDPTCSTDAACAADTNTDTDTDTNTPGPETDCADGNDNDNDGDIDCADSDCAGGTSCDEALGYIEIGNVTASAASWSATATAGWEVYGLDATSAQTPATRGCEISFTQTGSAPPAACTSCDYAFTVTFADSSAQSGAHCDTLDLHDTGGNAFSVDGQSYGYGFDPAYDDGQGGTVPVLMYYSKLDSSWGAASGDVTVTSGGFTYAWVLSQGMYYY